MNIFFFLLSHFFFEHVYLSSIELFSLFSSSGSILKASLQKRKTLWGESGISNHIFTWLKNYHLLVSSSVILVRFFFGSNIGKLLVMITKSYENVFVEFLE